MVNKLKRTYSEIANALELRKSELGTDSYAEQFDPNVYSGDEMLDGFTKYLNVVEKCSSKSNSQGCGGYYKIKPQNKTNDGFGNVKTQNIWGSRVILNDGTLIWFSQPGWTQNCETTYPRYEKDENGNYTNVVDGKPVPEYYTAIQCAEIFFDINGPNKGRNQFGYDCFSFSVNPNKFDQHTGYGGMYDTIRTGKLNYERYSEGEY